MVISICFLLALVGRRCEEIRRAAPLRAGRPFGLESQCKKKGAAQPDSPLCNL